MSAFQVCARCGTRWPVGGAPGTWCARCHGVLLSPIDTRAPADNRPRTDSRTPSDSRAHAPGRRNYRWTARPPHTRRRSGKAAPAQTPTPRYDATPRWGLVDRPVGGGGEAPDRIERYARAAPGLVTVTGALLLLASVSELFRYGILLFNRTRLVDPVTLLISDALVLFAQVAALAIGLGTVIAAACWLVQARRLAFADARTVDPRRPRWMVLLTVLPIVRLVMPGVYLTELLTVRGGVRQRELTKLVRIWWAVWVLGNIFVGLQILWRNPVSLQGKADGVLWAAFVALFGAATAALTLLTMRRIEHRDLRGSARKPPTRWVVSVVAPAAPAASVDEAEPAVSAEKVAAS